MLNYTTRRDSHSIEKCDKLFIYSKYLQKFHVLDRVYAN